MTDNGQRQGFTDLSRLLYERQVGAGLRNMEFLQTLSSDDLSPAQRNEWGSITAALSALVLSLQAKSKSTTDDLLSMYKKALQDGTTT